MLVRGIVDNTPDFAGILFLVLLLREDKSATSFSEIITLRMKLLRYAHHILGWSLADGNVCYILLCPYMCYTKNTAATPHGSEAGWMVEFSVP